MEFNLLNLLMVLLLAAVCGGLFARFGYPALMGEMLAGIVFGVISGLNKGRWYDTAILMVTLVIIAIPIFVIGPLLQAVFSLRLSWLPVGGITEGWRSLVLPVIVLALPNIAYISRLTRTSMIETLRENYVRTARAKGVGWRRVLWRHTLTGALLPVIAYLGPATAAIITGSILIETIFAVPGIGRHFVDAALNRDYPLVMGITLLYGGILILFNIATDVVRAILDPRIRNER